MNRATLSLLAAGVATLVMSTAALAADTEVVRSTRVGYADLNLAGDAGVAHLYTRLRSAANRVCEYAAFHDVIDQTCTAHALDRAVAAIGNDKLVALHARTAGVTRLVASTG
jgi:UrcA family protein